VEILCLEVCLTSRGCFLHFALHTANSATTICSVRKTFHLLSSSLIIKKFTIFSFAAATIIFASLQVSCENDSIEKFEIDYPSLFEDDKVKIKAIFYKSCKISNNNFFKVKSH